MFNTLRAVHEAPPLFVIIQVSHSIRVFMVSPGECLSGVKCAIITGEHRSHICAALIHLYPLNQTGIVSYSGKVCLGAIKRVALYKKQNSNGNRRLVSRLFRRGQPN